MLEHEHQLNRERLQESRGASTAFFSFADTVSARSYKGGNECHGWMGVKFQSHPRDQDSCILIHVRMLDRENLLQQEALGIIGVNLLFGAFFHFHEPEQLVESLLDGLTTSRVEIDMIEFSGIEFRYVDNRFMSLKLVELGLSGAAMFDPAGHVLQPSEALYKKHVLVQRGNFRPVCLSHLDILRSARERQLADLGPAVRESDHLELAELTLQNLRNERGELDKADFLARADTLAAAGKTVLVSDYFEFHRLAGYIARYTKKQPGFVIGAGTLSELFGDASAAGLEGGMLEAFGRLFRNDLILYVYPLLDPTSGELTTAENFDPGPRLRGLYRHLLSAGSIRGLDNYDSERLPIFSRDVLAKLQRGETSWEALVPPPVAAVIRARGLFGFRAQKTAA
jgi:hypothetical protein